MKYPQVWLKSWSASIAPPHYSMSFDGMEQTPRLVTTEITMMHHGSNEDMANILALKKEPVYILTYAQLKELVGTKIDEILTQE